MTKEDDKWVSQLRKRMDDYTESLPEGLWERIEADVPSRKAIPFWRTRGFAAAASVAVVMVASVTAWLLHSPSAHYMKGEGVSAEMHRPQAEEQIPASQLAETPVPETVQPTAQPCARLYSPLRSSVQPVSDGAKASSLLAETPARQVVATETPVVASTDGTPRNKTSNNKERQQADKWTMERNRQLLASAGKSGASPSWSVGLATGGTPYATSGQIDMGDQRLLFAAMDGMADAGENNVLVGKNYVTDNTEAEAHHRMPISVGASVTIAWSEKWAFETGLYYTYLSSELKTVSGKRYKVDQKLHYLGVPLKVHRQLWQNSWLSVYTSGGVMVEKCVKGTQDITETYTAYSALTQGVQLGVITGIPSGMIQNVGGLSSQFAQSEDVLWTSSEASNVERVDVEAHPWQFSVQLAVGAQVKLGKNFGLYVEPGAAYYIDDQSSLYTIRKEHPLNFNLQVGVRYRFSK